MRLWQFRITTRQSMLAVAGVGVAFWLSATAIRVDADLESRQIYHCFEGNGGTIKHWDGQKITYGSIPNFHCESHRAPFWPRYWRRLMGLTWPGNYTCHNDLFQWQGLTTTFAGPIYQMVPKFGEENLFMARAKAELKKARDQGS